MHYLKLFQTSFILLSFGLNDTKKSHVSFEKRKGVFDVPKRFTQD
ncbi:hypothetical protein B0O79_2650 [Flavobacteriaceae bacterium MAR_2009_75]|nr:hypothetical protein B0O79_2650 [Flavobacteriaceae bacterium MAR_2009_75]